MPGLAVDHFRGFAEARRMPVAGDRAVGVVVDQDEVGSPHGSRRRRRAKREIHDGEELFGPVFDRAEGGRAPIVVADKVCHFARSEDSVGRGVFGVARFHALQHRFNVWRLARDEPT